MHHDELDPVVVVDRGVAGIKPGPAGTAGQDEQSNNEREKLHGEMLYTLTIMQQCNVSPRRESGCIAILNKMEQLASAQFHTVTSGIFRSIERLIGSFEYQITVFARFEGRHADGHGYRYRLAFEVERTSFDGRP